MSALLGMLAASLVGYLISAGVSFATAQTNIASQQYINSQNIEAQKAINAENVENQLAINQQNIDYSREFAQNSIQWKVDDLKAAGLNPVLAAGGFSGSASPGVLSSPVQKAPYQQAPFLDMSGVSSAVNAMSNMMLTNYLLSQRNDIQSKRNDVMSEKNDVLRDLYKRKGAFMDSKNNNHLIHSAQELSPKGKEWEKEWDKIMKELKEGKF